MTDYMQLNDIQETMGSGFSLDGGALAGRDIKMLFDGPGVVGSDGNVTVTAKRDDASLARAEKQAGLTNGIKPPAPKTPNALARLNDPTVKADNQNSALLNRTHAIPTPRYSGRRVISYEAVMKGPQARQMDRKARQLHALRATLNNTPAQKSVTFSPANKRYQMPRSMLKKIGAVVAAQIAKPSTILGPVNDGIKMALAAPKPANRNKRKLLTLGM